MRLTICLCSGIRDVTVRRWNKVWECRGKFYDVPPRIPRALANKGVRIVAAEKIVNKPQLEKWEPPPEHPAFDKPVPLEERPSWKSEPAFWHQSNVRLFEGVKQACLIAKAQEMVGFPPAVRKLIGAVDVPDKDLLLQRYIMQSQVWNTDEKLLPKRFDERKPRWNWKKQFGITPLKSSQILLRNLLRLCQSQVTEFPALRSRQQVVQPLVQSYINYKGKPVVMREMMDMLLTSDVMLSPFAEKDKVDASASYKLPDMWPIYPTVDFLQTNNYNLDNGTGFKEDKVDDQFTCPHTIIQFPRKYHWEKKHYQASQIMSCLMYTAALARRKFGDDVKILPEPISIQHILMEQGNMFFTFFQLNTLDLDSEDSIKNLVWIGGKDALFTKTLGQPWMKREKRLDRYKNFNPKAFDKFLAVYLNGVPGVLSDVERKKVESVEGDKENQL